MGIEVSRDAPTSDIYVFLDPLYKQPLVLGTDLAKIRRDRHHICVTAGRWNSPTGRQADDSLHRQFVLPENESPASGYLN